MKVANQWALQGKLQGCSDYKSLGITLVQQADTGTKLFPTPEQFSSLASQYPSRQWRDPLLHSSSYWWETAEDICLC